MEEILAEKNPTTQNPKPSNFPNYSNIIMGFESLMAGID